MKFYSVKTCLIEVPDHISLGFTILGCPIHCPDCHSKWTWDKDQGESFDFSDENLDYLLNPYISCLLFFGGEWEPDFEETIKRLKDRYRLSLALYTGLELEEAQAKPWFKLLDYIKVGPYIKELGGLRERTTNQSLYLLNNGVIVERKNMCYKW